MDRSILIPLLAIGAVALVGFVGRRLAKRDDEMPGVIRTDLPAPDVAGAIEEASASEGTPVAEPGPGAGGEEQEPAAESQPGGDDDALVTTGGRVFVADPMGVWVIPQKAEDGSSWRSQRLPTWRETQHVQTGWEPGGLAGARIV